MAPSKPAGLTGDLWPTKFKKLRIDQFFLVEHLIALREQNSNSLYNPLTKLNI